MQFLKKHAPILRTTASLNKMSDSEGVVLGSRYSILDGDVEVSCFVDFCKKRTSEHIFVSSWSMKRL